MDKKVEKNTEAVVALVCGILSIILSWIYFANFAAIALGIVAIVFAVKGRKIDTNRGMATAGLVCGIIGLVLACTVGMCSVCAYCTVRESANDLNNLVNQLNSLK